MEKKNYCGDCEGLFLSSELHWPDAYTVEWLKAMNVEIEPKCEDCAEKAFDADQENLTRFANSI